MNINLKSTNVKLKKIVDEEWKFIPHTSNQYQVSNYGRIKSYFVDEKEGKIVKPGIIKGYKSVVLKINGERKTILIHKLVAEGFIPKINDLQTVVIHKDWSKLNNHVSNLEWVSKEESFNRAHAKMILGRKKRGKIITHSKLSKDDVKAIKKMLNNGRQQKVIAQLFCVSEMQISRIKNNVSWAEVSSL